MNKLQRVTLILAAFGIISILLAQTQSYSFSKNESTRDAANSQLLQSSFAGNKLNINIPISGGDPQPRDIITNIYQSGSGSFYLEQASNHEQGANTYTASMLQSTNAEITVTGPIARTRLTQVFRNTSDTVASGIYVFPLPQDAAVDHLLMQVGERKIEGLIKPKKQAQAMFTSAKAQGKSASLVSQIRPNIFTNKIANIAPHTNIIVTIEYQQFIVQDQYNFALTLPLSITPRYSPADSMNTESKQASYAHSNKTNLLPLQEQTEGAKTLYLPAKTNISVRLNTGLPVNQITSLHHPVKTSNPHSTEYHIELDTDKLKNKDFVLQWQLRPSYRVQASHFTYQADNYEYGLITLMPPINDKLTAKRNMVFILDVSGSMVGEALTQAKQALALAIQDLHADDYFNLIAFSSHANKLWQRSQAASFVAKDEALAYIYGLEANGGTEISKALDLAFSLPPLKLTENLSEEHGENIFDNHRENQSEKADEKQNVRIDTPYLNQIVFITDGSVSNENELMQKIYRDLGQYRLFTVGIGSAPNAYFMTEAAAAGKGTFTFIGDIKQVKSSMQKLLEKLKRPALTDIELNIKDAQQAFGFEVYPSILPDLYAGEPLVISYRRQVQPYSQENHLPFSVQGQYLAPTVAGEWLPRRWSSQLPNLSAERQQGIHKYWARLKIKDLHQQLNMQTPYSESYKTLKNNIEQAITTVALAHHLVSQYTSLVAIDHSSVTHNRQNFSSTHKTMDSAARLTQYAQAQLPQTATPAALFALLGSLMIILGGISVWRNIYMNKQKNNA